MNKIKRLVSIVLACMIFATFQTTAFASEPSENTMVSEDAISAEVNGTVVSSFVLTAAVGGVASHEVTVSGYGTYEINYNILGSNGAVINLSTTIPNGTKYAIANSSTIGEFNPKNTICHASGTYRFKLDNLAYPGNPKGATVLITIYGR